MCSFQRNIGIDLTQHRTSYEVPVCGFAANGGEKTGRGGVGI